MNGKTLSQRTRSTTARKWISARLAPVAWLALVLHGCAETTPKTDVAFPANDASGMFSSGFRHIHERYIEPIALSDVALSGMERLTALTKDLEVTRTGDEIRLTSNGSNIQTFGTPGIEDVAAWGNLTIDLVRVGRAVSWDLRNASSEEIYQAVFDGLLSPLDAYSRYHDADFATRRRASREGFGGIGIRLEVENDEFRVLEVLPELPAARAGLQSRDAITAIDGEPIAGMNRKAVIKRLRGPIDTRVVLSVRRPPASTALRLSLTRELILPPTVTFQKRDGIGYFRVTSFNRMTAANLARKLAHARHEMGGRLQGIVMDLRGNPGGLLDQAVSVADIFLDAGVILSTRGRHRASNNQFMASPGDLSGGLPIAILINGRSASAAEAVAAALQDWGRAVVIGTSSYGKGSVQNVVQLPNGGELMLTWSHMHAPSGYSMHRLGVLPGICTNPAKNIALLDQRRGARSDVAKAFAAWRSYVWEDADRAASMRRACPASDDEPDIDIEMATRVLKDRRIYARALRPWADAVAQSPATRH